MPTWKDVTRIALSLPKTEVSTSYGTPSVKVAGKGFLRLRTEAEGGLVVLCDFDRKEELLGRKDPAFYTTPHYDGYPAIFVNLKKVRRAELVDLITESWRRKAPVRLLREFDRSASRPAANAPRAREGRSTSRERRR